MTTRSLTSIKVPIELRDRRARNAAREGRPAAGLIATLLDDLDRRRRFAAVRAAYALADAAYRTEVDEWARLSDDGLARTDRVLREGPLLGRLQSDPGR